MREDISYKELFTNDVTPHIHEKAMLIVTFQISFSTYDAINGSVAYCWFHGCENGPRQ